MYELTGGTVDIAIHEVQHHGKLKAIYRPSGGVWGGTKVDDEFQSFLLKLCGMVAIRSLSKHDMIEVQRGFEKAKAKVTSTSQTKIHIKLPVELLRSISPGDYEGQYHLTVDKLSLSPNLIREFFVKAIQKIIQHVKELFVQPELSDINYILMVGGFSESMVLQNAIKNAFPFKTVRSVLLANSAVVRGAVMYGHVPKIIQWRRAAFTYGIQISRDFEEENHDRHKKVYIDGEYYCTHIFDRFIGINDQLEVGKHTVTRVLTPLSRYQTAMSLDFYRSNMQNPKYITDSGCTRIGTVRVQMPDLTGGKNRYIHLTVTFADTEIKVEAVNEKSAEKVVAEFDFLSD